MTFVYLDHAATSWPKPEPVTAAIAEWYATLGVSAERGDSSRTALVAARMHAVRRELARRCGVPAQRVAFTSGATEAVNLVLRGLLASGDRVVTTATEHNAVARPLVGLRDELDITFQVVPCDGAGEVDPDAIRRALVEHETRLVVVSHASNVTGAVQDVGAICAVARELGALSLLDASQTAGATPIDVGADLIVASAHKGLLGPPGLGFVAAREGVELRPIKWGGTGSSRAIDRPPTHWPTAFEAGTPNTPAILGLGAALEWLDHHPDVTRMARQHAIVDATAELLAARGRIRVLRPPEPARHLPILSFVLDDLDPAEVGILLDEAGIHARTGFHCAPWIHAQLGTAAAGTVRLSPGPFVNEDAPQRVAAALCR